MQNEYTYLCHHGIKGQKWGKRNYQYEDGTYTPEGRKRYGIGDRIKEYRAHTKRSYLREARRTAHARAKQAKGLINKSSELFGYGRMKTRYEHLSKYEKYKASKARTRLGKAIRTTRSKNSEEFSKYFSQKQKQDIGKRAFESLIYNKTLADMPVHRLSGRKSTYLKEVLDYGLTGGIYGQIQDYKYKRNKNKS